MMKGCPLLVSMVGGAVVFLLALRADAQDAVPQAPVLDIGSRLELFVDDWLIDRKQNVRLCLHHPVRREVALRFDAAWEGSVSGYVGLFQDGSRYRMYYRGSGEGADHREVTCYAESPDGAGWTRPELGLFEFQGSRRNNIVLTGEGTHCLAVFKDGNPRAAASERYKAVSRSKVGSKPCLIAFVSPDGLHWRKMQSAPILTVGAFDSQNTALWDAARERYVAFVRDFRDGVRSIRTSTSKDFRQWTPPVFLDFGDAPPEHLYTNAIVPYFRAPHIYLGMPMRFVPDRKFFREHPHHGVSDGVFMSSRDGVHWDRRFGQAFIRPGLDPGNWTDRSNMPAWGILPTGDDEMSIYWTEHYRTAGTRLRRGTLRRDGFVSVRAPAAGGEFVTKPLTFTGNELVLNYATSAAGGVRVEIEDGNGEPIAGYGLADVVEIYGDELERVVAWKGGSDVSGLAGRPVRLRFVMKDADVYAMRFCSQ